MNNITMKMNADEAILSALREDITSEDITTNSVMPEYRLGEVDLICKQDGILAGLDVFKRVFELLDPATKVIFFAKDGDEVKAGCGSRRHSGASFRGTDCSELPAENERHCHLYPFHCKTVGRHQNQAFRHPENHSQYADL